MIKLNIKEQLLCRIREFVKSNRLLTPSVVVLTSTKADEYKALTLFSENMRMASECLQYALQLTRQPAIHTMSYYMYASAILLYRQMFKVCSGIKRDQSKINLIGGAIRNKDGAIKTDSNKATQKITPDRFYIEEFFNHTAEGFNTYFNMIGQADKYLCHFDKESDKNAHAILVFEGDKPFHLLNHFEYLMFDVKDLQKMYDHCIVLKNLTDEKLKIVAQELWTAAVSSSLEDHKENQIYSSGDFQLCNTHSITR
jgi:hypothetical protein